jgi:hypothetical protein
MENQPEIKYKVRKWNMEDQTTEIVYLTLDQMVREPISLNMSDVGVILLNQVRGRMGLAPLNEQAVSDGI